MNRSKLKILVRLGVAALISLLALIIAYQFWDRHEMIRTTLEWARLAPFPKSATHFSIDTEGSMFSRAFRASFSAPMADVESWLRESPGTRDITPERPSPTKRRFLISPGGGAKHAEVTVDDATGRVTVYVYWS